MGWGEGIILGLGGIGVYPIDSPSIRAYFHAYYRISSLVPELYFIYAPIPEPLCYRI